MKITHFEALKPVCPRCRASGLGDMPLVLAAVDVEDAHGVRFGALTCSNRACWLEFPIIDGAPVLVPDVKGWIAANIAFLSEREDLPERCRSQLADCAGPDSPFVASLQHRSNYAWDHWGEYDAGEFGGSENAVSPGGVVRLLRAGLALVAGEGFAGGPRLDLGTACGRGAFELAAESGADLVLGIDLNWPLLRIARRALERSEVAYPRRRVGTVFDDRRFTVPVPGADRVDFWVADALALPFADATFAVASALNLLDCVGSPVMLLHELERAVRDVAVVATPFDWSAAVTAPEAWLGGHSQRAPDGGSSAVMLDRLLTPGAHPQSLSRLRGAGNADVAWHVRLHERATMHYVSRVTALKPANRPPVG